MGEWVVVRGVHVWYIDPDVVAFNQPMRMGKFNELLKQNTEQGTRKKGFFDSVILKKGKFWGE